jgi:bacterioferritin-associated ferredoxin
MSSSYFQRPYQFTYSATVNLAKTPVTLYFDLKDSDVVEHLYYYGEGISPLDHRLFTICCQLVQGLSLEDIVLLSWEDIFDCDEEIEQLEKLPLVCLPLYLIQREVYKLLGQAIVKPAKEIVCFCFAISKSEVTNFLQQNPQATLFDITNNLNAGGACQSCLAQLEQLFYEQRRSSCDYSHLTIESIEQTLVQWQELENYFKMGLLHLADWDGAEGLIFKVSNPDKFADLTWQIEHYLFEKLTLYFKVRFEHF